MFLCVFFFSSLSLALVLPCPRDKWVELQGLGHSCISYGLTHTQRQGWHKEASHAEMRGDVTHLDFFPGKGQGIPCGTWQLTVSLRHVSGIRHPIWYQIHSGQDGRLIFPPAEGLLLLSVRSNGCFCLPRNGPNGLEGDFDMVRFPCVFLPWAGTCPEAVCEAVMVPHFHWMWCLGYQLTV